MKRTLILVSVIAISFSFYAFSVFESKSTEFLQKLGIPEEFAKDCIWSSLSGMYLSHPGGTRLLQVSTSERATMTREIASYARSYTKSGEFKKKYLEYRETRKPTPPEKPKPMAQLKKEQKEQYQKSISETEESMKTMSADQKKMMKDVVDMFRQQLKSLDDPNNTMYGSEMDKMQTQGYEMELQEHKERLATWEQENPSAPDAMIKRWLTEFRDVSKGIDLMRH
jgi:flagellar biosynthesis GTPase FlhF